MISIPLNRGFRMVIFSLVAVLVFFSVTCAPKAVPSSVPEAAPALAPGKQAWEVEWERTLVAARKEGSVSLYTAAGTAVREAITKPFQDKYGIALEMVSGTGSTITPKIMNERRAGIYMVDVVRIGHTNLILELKPDGVLDPIEPILILPEVINPKAWYKGKGVPYADKDHMVISFFLGSTSPVAINTNLVEKNELKSAQDLLNPKWKGKMVMTDPTQSGGTGLTGMGVTYEIMGIDYLKKLVAQEPYLTRDRRLGAEWLARGKYAIWFAPLTEAFNIMKTAGAPIEHAFIPELTYLSVGGGNLSLMNKAPHQNAAKVFINWALSKEGQTLWSRASGSHSARLDVSDEYVPEERLRIPGFKYAVIVGNEEFVLKQPEQQKIMEQIFGPLVGR